MPALKPLPSLAQVEANRANAAKSTGPRTDAGKARSRGNALKHGMAGAGVALPTEDAEALRGRAEALHEQFRPATPLGAYLVDRVALAMLRTERAARHEAAVLGLRVRHAVAEFDAARAAGADAALARLRLGEGHAARRDLLRTTEGIDRLLGELAGLRRCLDLPEPLWSQDHGARLDACLGNDPDPIVPSRVEALSVAALGIAADLLSRRDLAAIAEAGGDESAYAFGQIASLIDQEIAALRRDRAGIDPAEVEADRLGAADRALFDPSPAAQLARRYEAAAARDLARSLRLLREAEADAPTPSPAEDVPVGTEGSQATAPDSPTPGPAAGPIEEAATVVASPLHDNELTAVLASSGWDGLIGAGVGPIGAGRPSFGAGGGPA